MTSTLGVLRLALPLLYSFHLRTSESAEWERETQARGKVRFVRSNDKCSKRWSLSAQDDCVAAYNSFIILPVLEQRKSCVNPKKPECRWFQYNDGRWYRMCSFICDLPRNLQPEPDCCWPLIRARRTRRVPLADIVPTLDIWSENPTNSGSGSIPIAQSSGPGPIPMIQVSGADPIAITQASGTGSQPNAQPGPKPTVLPRMDSVDPDIDFKAEFYLQQHHSLFEAQQKQDAANTGFKKLRRLGRKISSLTMI